MLLQQYKMRWKHSEHRPTILHGKVIVRVLKAAHSSIMDVHSLSILNLVRLVQKDASIVRGEDFGCR